ncbi:Predicted arabinose efflux permease, MFS family [Faunimonas pinastri]|uniref:Predicted arabinose efflux permease, MFS family n=1 Tax=Faunimonas pinastri TaxID=1855383 RepID=A0A1H9C1D1_9HYPH|nr:MFS transporter [Faunimonas pinastri]SEP95076.1 Predicted arabinose efflux permease, MFS family [Faunimonas pinastri]
MTSLDAASRHLPGRAEQFATRTVFFIPGFAGAAWAALVPFAKARLGISDGTLGLLLLCLGAGSVVTMPLAGAMAGRFGCRRVLTVAAIAAAITLPLLATVSSIAPFVLTLLLFGASIGTMDVVINIQAIIVERASGRSMMSGFHGMFSVGGILGAGGMALLLSLGTSPLAASLCIAGLMLLALAISANKLLPYGSESGGPAFAVPHGVVLLIGVLCCVCFLAEGAVLDWSAVFLTQVHRIPTSYAGLGYAAFATTMTFGRLTGDRVVERLGGRHVMMVGGVLAALGFALGTFIPSWEVALLGYALVGAGCSNIVPVLFSAVGRQNVMPERIAVPAVTTLGYAGILAGPAGIGFIAHLSSLPVAFLVIAAMMLGLGFSGSLLQTGKTNSPT